MYCLVLVADLLTYMPAAVCYCLYCLTSCATRNTQVHFVLALLNVQFYNWFIIIEFLAHCWSDVYIDNCICLHLYFMGSINDKLNEIIMHHSHSESMQTVTFKCNLKSYFLQVFWLYFALTFMTVFCQVPGRPGSF